jgi:hypothetical protein
MARAKFDILIETVRYAPDGKIDTARVFERRGAAFSDHFLMSRETLLEKLEGGKKCVTGQRKEFLAGTFETDKTVQVSNGFITTGPQAGRDMLEGVPIF